MEVKLPFGLTISKESNNDLSEKNQQITTNNSRIINNSAVFMGANGEAYIKDGYQNNPHLYSVIRMILREAVKVDFILYEVEKSKAKTLKRKLKNEPLTVKASDKMEVGEHDLLKLIYNPNPQQGKAAFLEENIGFKLITGTSYIHQLWPDAGVNKGITKEMYNLATPLVQVKFDNYAAPVSYTVKVGAKSTTVPAEEVIIFKYFNPNGNLGQSPIMSGRGALGQSNDSYTANMKILQNTGAAGVLTYPNSPGDQFDTKKQQKLENKYYSRYGGLDNYGRIMVTNAAVKWEQIGLPATDLALMESQNMSKRDICNIYGISSQLLNDTENSTYNNVKEARNELISNVVIPELKAFTDELNRVLVPKFEKRDNKEYYLALDLSVYPELKEDEQKLADILAKSYWLTTNEKRTKQGLDEIDGDEMNEILIPSNLVPIGTTDEQLLERAFNEGKTPTNED